MEFGNNDKIIRQLTEISNMRSESLRRADETLQNLSVGVVGEKILTTSFKDTFLEAIASSPAFLNAQTQQDASSVIVASFERELTQMNISNDLHATLRRNFILTLMSEK